MSSRTLVLPVRSLSRQTHHTQWICRRCLATQQTSSPTISSPEPPPQRILKDPSETSTYDATLPSSQRDYRLTKTDFHLKKPLSHKIPRQYLQHSTSELLHQNEKKEREKAIAHKRIMGVVVSAGKMEKTVKVRCPGRRWEGKIGKVGNKTMMRDGTRKMLTRTITVLQTTHEPPRTRSQFVSRAWRCGIPAPPPRLHGGPPCRRIYYLPVR